MMIRQRHLLLASCLLALARSLAEKPLNRRQALLVGTAAGGLSPCLAADKTTIDMDAINAARKKTFDSFSIRNPKDKTTQSGTMPMNLGVIPVTDPPPLLSIHGGKGDSSIKIPRIGYSFYNTADADQAARCTCLALLTGVRHLDVASQYGTSAAIAKPLGRYLNVGLSGLDVSNETQELFQTLKATSAVGDSHAREVGASSWQASVAPPPDGSIGRRGRREELFINYKLSNAEQSVDSTAVQRAVKSAISTLGCSYFDMISIHSPLSDEPRRLATYSALLKLRDAGFVRSVGVCNYGLGPLQEIASAGMELPAMNQLELSPFNTHEDVVAYCKKFGVAVGCSAWSKLSSTQGIQDAWLDVVGGIAKKVGVTKAQVLVRWSMQKGYTCAPRSAAKSKVERIAIAENSYGGVSGFVLTEDEIKRLDALNVPLKAGSLGRRDGWEDSDVTGASWDPTDY